MFDDPVSE